MLIWTVSQSGLAAQTSVLSQQGLSTEWELLHPAGLAEPRVALGTGLSWGGTSARVLTVTAGPDLMQGLCLLEKSDSSGDCNMQRQRQFSK